MSNPKTTLEVLADIKDLQSKMAMVDKTIEETSAKAVIGSQKMGAGFTTAGKQSAAGTAMMADGSKQASYALTNLNWLVSDSPYLFQNMRMGIMSVSNNINPLMNGFVLLKKEMGSNKAVFKALTSQLTGPAGIATALTAVIAIVQVISIVMAKNKAKTEGSTEANKEYVKSLEQIQKATSIDNLQSQVDQSVSLIKISEQRINKLKEENDQFKLNEERMRTLQKASKNFGYAFDASGQLMSFKAIDKELEGMIDNFKNLHPEASLKKFNAKNILKFYEDQGKENQKIIEQEETKNKLRKDQIDINNKANIPSEKEERYKEKLLEVQTARLPIEEQIAVWEAELAKISGDTTEDKEKRLDIDRKIYTLNSQKVKLEAEIANLTAGQLDGDKKIAALKALQSNLNQSNLEDMKEYLVLQGEIDKIQNASNLAREEAEKKYKLIVSGVDTESKRFLINKINDIQAQIDAEEDGTERRKELETDLYNFKIDLWEKEKDALEAQRNAEEQYQKDLAGLISQGSLESVYEDMFSRIKQQVLQHWLAKLGITKAMMNMEELIVAAGENGIDGIKNFFHQRELERQARETAAAAQGAGMKGVESASGIPFPGNIAAIGIVLASVFSSLRKAKVTGTQIVAAAEGAIINKPTLLLAGEALNRSGTEIVMPEKNFNRYMERDIIPGIMAKVNVDNSGLKAELKQVRSAIYEIGRQIPIETGKAVKRSIKGRF